MILVNTYETVHVQKSRLVLRYDLNAVCVCLVVHMNFHIIAFSEMKEYNKRKRQEYIEAHPSKRIKANSAIFRKVHLV